MEERDVVRIRELLCRRSGELAETDREHRAPQRVLKRLSGAEVGCERECPDDFGRTDRLLARGHVCSDVSVLLRCHGGILGRIAQRERGVAGGGYRFRSV